MKKFWVQTEITITVQKEIKADSLEHAIAEGDKLKSGDLIRTKGGVDWSWDDIRVTGVYE